MFKRTLFLLLFFISLVAATAQSNQAKKTVKKIIQLNTELEFTELSKLFDTAKGRKINPYLLHYVWTSLRDKYGHFKGSSTKETYTKNNKEFVIEELQFDSGFVQLKVSINTKNNLIASYFLIKEQTREMYELEKKYKLPSYAQKSQTIVKEIQFGTAPYIIQGELILPAELKRKEKVPVVVLVHGSGSSDRNEQNGPQQPFKDIAYGLATHKIAVLRYDKRTLTYGEECTADSAFDVNKETVDDALIAAQFLRQQKNIDPAKIFILGHSLGGMMLPRIGLADTALAGLIFMAAPAKSLPDKIIEQMDYLSTLFPEKKEEYAKGKDEFIRLKTKWYDSATPARYLPFNSPPSYWMDLDNYNQTQVVQKVTQPMLFLQGDADYQVTIEDFELWKEALKNNPLTTFKVFKSLTHNMITGVNTPPSPDDYNTVDNVHESVIKAIVTWIKK